METGGKVYRFNVNEIINAKNMAIIKPDLVSKTVFYWCSQDCFQILNDQKTLIGIGNIGYFMSSEIVIEDITNTDPNYVPVKFIIEGGETNTILIDEDRNCMFFGNNDGIVVQYSIDIKGYSRKIIKNYGDLGIGWIISSLRIGNIAVFGGNNSSLAFINIDSRQHLGNVSDLAMKWISSIELCTVKNKSDVKLLLTVGGSRYDYSGSKTDVIDITEFIKSGEWNVNISKTNHINSQK